MRLVLYGTSVEVKEGDHVIGTDGNKYLITYAPKPHKPSSEGTITAKDEDGESHEYYCSVFNCEWVDREDRQ